MSIDSTGMYFNPYAAQLALNNTGAYNNDFMTQALNNQMSTGYIQGYQQPKQDVFQKEGQSGLATGLKLGTVAGLGTGAGMYFLGTNPVENGKVASTILEAIDENEFITEFQQKVVDNVKVQKEKILKKHKINNFEEYNLLKNTYLENKLASGAEAQKAKKLIDAIEKEFQTKIDINKIGTNIADSLEKTTLAYNKQELQRLQGIEKSISQLAENADATAIKKFLKDNAKAFGIEGSNQVIEHEVNNLAAKYTSKATLLAEYSQKVKAQKTTFEAIQNSLNTKAMSYWDDAAKTITKDAPEAISKAFNNFKFNKAGKYAAIAGGTALVLGWLFGGNKS